jgi:hypothetical protein
LTEREISAFVGKNADYYIRHWPHPRDLYGRARGFNWAAFFLGGLWIPYRKMYRATLILFAIVTASVVVDLIADDLGFKNPIGRIFQLAVAFVCGRYGNGWYLAHTRREVARVRALGLEDNAYDEALRRRGGTSLLASIGLFVLFLLAVLVLGVAIGLFLQEE